MKAKIEGVEVFFIDFSDLRAVCNEIVSESGCLIVHNFCKKIKNNLSIGASMYEMMQSLKSELNIFFRENEKYDWSNYFDFLDFYKKKFSKNNSMIKLLRMLADDTCQCYEGENSNTVIFVKIEFEL